jgi:diaminopimelate epimerase
MDYTLYKMHGSKNTFYLLDLIDPEVFDYIAFTKWLCHSSNNEGADGLLLVLPSDNAHAKMRVINADGSEASMCGNGLRCVARYICERDEIQSATIETLKATLHIEKAEDLLEHIATYSVEISPINFQLDSLPMIYQEKQQIKHEVLPVFSQEIPFTAVSVPNPHLIGIVSKHYIANTAHQERLATFLNGENQYTPDGINVSYVYPMSNQEIFVRTFERGVGFTNACGTAMTASALVASIYNYVDQPLVTVYNPGGFVKVSVNKDATSYQLNLIGNATYIEKSIVRVSEGNFEFIAKEINKEAAYYEEVMKSFHDSVNSRIKIS